MGGIGHRFERRKPISTLVETPEIATSTKARTVALQVGGATIAVFLTVFSAVARLGISSGLAKKWALRQFVAW